MTATTSRLHLTIRVDERRYGRAVTIVEGFSMSSSEIDSPASELTSSPAAGGTATEDTIELQGDHRDRLPELLTERVWGHLRALITGVNF